VAASRNTRPPESPPRSPPRSRPATAAGIAHRDVKPDNLLFDAATGALKLADFGSAKWFGDRRAMTGLVGTPYYVAPEMIVGREYSEKVDVWSAGVVLYTMLSGK
jgi:serine/threonine protein kinase